MTPACPMCGETASRPRFTVRGFPLLECRACRGYFLAAPDRGAGAEYRADYLHRGEGGAERLTGYFDYESELELHLHNFEANLAIVRRHARGPRLLDIGCASGHFLLAASRAGFEVMGIDVSDAAISRVRERWGFAALAGDPAKLELPGRFDVITMWETIEHLADPAAVLGRVRAWLEPDGVLIIGTGDNRSPVARLLGRRWWYINPPDHVVYYNREALKRVLVRNGFRIEGWDRIFVHRVSSRNVMMKLLRSFQVGAGRALAAAKAVPDLPLTIVHGTTVVVVAKRSAG